jgi:hypothetical protein
VSRLLKKEISFLSVSGMNSILWHSTCYKKDRISVNKRTNKEYPSIRCRAGQDLGAILLDRICEVHYRVIQYALIQKTQVETRRVFNQRGAET